MAQTEFPLWIVRDRLGRDIVLSEDIWYNHIVLGHRILRGYDAAVAKVLTNPYRVMHDVLYGNRECFYRQRTHPDFPDLLLKVCVEFESADTGMVITAFLTPSIRAGEVQRWP
jgi:hypothetical protein